MKCTAVEVGGGEDSLGGACGLSAVLWAGGLGSTLTLGGSCWSQCCWMRRMDTPMQWRDQGAAGQPWRPLQSPGDSSTLFAKETLPGVGALDLPQGGSMGSALWPGRSCGRLGQCRDLSSLRAGDCSKGAEGGGAGRSSHLSSSRTFQ